MLQQELSANGVDISGCTRASDLPSGQGVVMLEPDGAASSVVLGGANTAWPEDVGGEDRPFAEALLPLLDFLSPNENELHRITGMPTDTLEQEPLPIPGGQAVDGTAAGDAFRAAFAVALLEGRTLQAALRFAAAAGAIAVSRKGAVPSLPTRTEVELLLTAANDVQAAAKGDDRRDLATAADGSNDVLGWIIRQGRVRGLHLVDLNYPQHFEDYTVQQVQETLRSVGLEAGAICLRFPQRFAAGAFTNPDDDLRKQAVQLAVQGCRTAADLGAKDLIIWSPYDGYNYHFQVDYIAAWDRAVSSFQQVADACPAGTRVSLEFKPTDASSRFSVVPSTGAALLLVSHVDRSNFGLTLDFGHLLLAGENPAQSVATVGQAGKLFGLQLNDAHVRLGAEDGLAFASVNVLASMEMLRWLQRVGYDGHVYFDTFPEVEDPVQEAEFNIGRFKELWFRAARLAAVGIDHFAKEHNGLGAMQLLFDGQHACHY
eukprot:gene4956-5197_t